MIATTANEVHGRTVGEVLGVVHGPAVQAFGMSSSSHQGLWERARSHANDQMVA